ncbi:MAG: sulfurtransferase TusA family protein [Gammaproteobacteria bacterium]|nr:MAG: sulfurtransferase TusA family protein [Gammaproteobacteria bacterium]
MEFEATQTLDVKGLQCPMPLLKTKLALNGMQAGDRLWVQTTDPGSLRDIPAFLALSTHQLIEQAEDQGVFHFLIECQGQKTGC